MKRQRWEPLEALARQYVGDGKEPNIYFVSQGGNIYLATQDFDVAYREWHGLNRSIESALEDRLAGSIASTEPREDGSNVLVRIDDAALLGYPVPDLRQFHVGR